GPRADDGPQPDRRLDRGGAGERGHVPLAHGAEPAEPADGLGVHMSATSEIPRADRPVGPVILRASHVGLYRDGQEVLRDVNLAVDKGEILGIVGPNGAGKTSLLRLIPGLERPSSGEITLFGEPVSRFRAWHRVGSIPQPAVG